jgi:filamentous hemagglutinin
LSINTTVLEGAGTLQSEGDLFLTIENAPQRVVGRSTRGEWVNHSKILAGRDLTVNALALNNQERGELRAQGGTTLTIEQTVSNRGMIDGGATLIKAGAVINQAGGRLHGRTRELHQTSGSGHVQVLAKDYVTLYGEIKADRDVQIDTAGSAFMGGLVQACNDLSVTAATTVTNNGWLVAGEPQGSIRLKASTIATSGTATAGKEILLTADKFQLAGTLSTPGKLALHTPGDIDLRQDALRRTLQGSTLEFTANNLLNAGGRLNVKGDLIATLSGCLDNAGGTLAAGGKLTATMQEGLDNAAGTLHAEGDLALTVNRALKQVGTLSSGGAMTLSVTGQLDNSGQVFSASDLTIIAPELHNATSGELVARGAHTLRVTQALTNTGLIDGGITSIDAARVSNQGRLYGDTLALRSGELTNEVGPAGAAILASHGDMDLGVETLTNREHALIYAGGNLRVGGALDSSAKAVGQARSLINRSATIEVAGNAAIAAASIHNENAHYASTVVHTSVTPKVYYRPEGSTERYDAHSTWLCDLVTPMCSKDPAWLNDDEERRMLKPSAAYPESRYGPPFDYAPSLKGRRGASSPIWPAILDPLTLFGDPSLLVELTGLSTDRAADWSKDYPADSKIWRVFGVNPPSGPEPKAPELPVTDFGFTDSGRPSDSDAVSQAKLEAQRAYDAYMAPVKALDQRIRAFNADFDHRMVKNFAIERVNERVYESRTLSTDPGLVLVNGEAAFNGTVVNDKSQIVVGGTLTVNGPAINNVGATGERRVEQDGTSTRTYERNGRRRYEKPRPYRAVLAVEPIELPVAVAAGADAAQSHLASTLRPRHQGVTVRPDANAPYLVATDPRLVGPREVVSSDLLFDLLHEVETGDDTTNGTLCRPALGKRLGDGFYEQQWVSQQIQVATGQRFLAPFSDNNAQYRALLSAGAQLAKAEGLKIGEPLTPTQIRQLTTDRAWLVQQTVTLPDGTTQQVLVPKVYLKAAESGAKDRLPEGSASPGGGTLLAGHEVNLAAATLSNSGTIGARDASVLTASDLIN